MIGKFCFLIFLTLLSIVVFLPAYLIGPSHIHHLFNDQFPIALNYNQHEIILKRSVNGFMTITTNELQDSFYGMGYAHALDRAFQMSFLRIVSQGRLSELLESSELTNKIDISLRQLGFYSQSIEAAQIVEKGNPEINQLLKAYCDGVNFYFQNEELPWEFRLLGLNPEPWKPQDSIAIMRVMLFVGLADTQMNLEKFIVQSLQNSKSHKVLQLLFEPFLDDISNITKKDQEILNSVNVELEIFPSKLIEFVPQLFRASNNWVVSGKKSESGFPIHSSDPHLNILQIPSIWYEVQINLKNDFFIFGTSVPGIPSPVLGRSNYLSWSITYGFMDHIDYFIEKCNDNTCEIDGKNHAISKSSEIILRKGKEPLTTIVYKTRNRVIERNLESIKKSEPLKEGYHLSRGYAHDITKGIPSLNSLVNLLKSKNVKEAQNSMKNADISANWLFADSKNIGYQQSGALPKRKGNGLFPLYGFDSTTTWKEDIVSGDDLHSIYNPEEGFIITANNLLQAPGKPISINAHMGSYRRDRIEFLLKSKEKLSEKDMKKFQADLHSTQWDKFAHIFKPAVRDRPASLAVDYNFWKMPGNYSTDQKGATVFEKGYEATLELSFAPYFNWVEKEHLKSLPGVSQDESLIAWKTIAPKIWSSIRSKIGIAYFHYFDKLLLSEDKHIQNLVYHGNSPQEFWQRALKRSVGSITYERMSTWGEVQTRTHFNLLFGNKFPEITNFLKLNRGPFQIPGGRSTICQGQLFTESDGRLVAFAPSWRFVTDMKDFKSWSILPGGPSGFFLSPFFDSDLEKYYAFEYKEIEHINSKN